MGVARLKSVPVMVSVAVVVALLLGWRLGSSRPAEATGAEEHAASGAIAVKTAAVSSRTIDDITEVTGTVAAVQRAELAPKIMGRVAEVYVQEGQRVAKGQVLLRIEAADLAAGVSQAAANSRAAAAAAAQAQTAAELQREQSRGRVQQAEEALRAAKAGLSATVEGARAQERATADQAVVEAEAEARTARANAVRFQRLYEQGAASAVEAEARQAAADVANARLEAARQQASLAHEGSRRQDIEAARAGVAQAEEALRVARASVVENRMKADQAQMAQAQLGQARAAAEAARVQHDYSLITAPFSGLIVSRLADPGDLATPGQPLLTIEDDSLYRLEAQVPEASIGHVEVGGPVRVTLDALNRTLDGTVSRIIPSADPGSHTFTVKADLPTTAGLRSGLFGRLALVTGTRRALLAPAAGVLQRGQLSQVYLVENGRAAMRLVTVGDRRGDQIEILSGLRPGDRIIVPAAETLSDGQAVTEAQ
jgi:RND family efflux transporter MFP subunit